MQGVCEGPVIESAGEPGTTSADDWAYYKVRDGCLKVCSHSLSICRPGVLPCYFDICQSRPSSTVK